MHDLVGFLEPGFVGYDPGPSKGREEAPAVGFVEALGTVVTEVELCEIAFVPTIGETAGKTGVTGRQGKLEGTGIGIQLLAGGQHQQAGNITFAKLPRITQTTLGVHRICDRLVTLGVSQVIRTRLIDTLDMVLSRVGVIGIQGIPIRLERTIDLKIGQARQIEQRHELQAFGNEVQILVDLNCRNHLGALAVAVTADQVGIRV